MQKTNVRILILGASGMLGSTLFRALSRDDNFITYGSVRDINAKRYFAPEFQERLISNVQVHDDVGLLNAFSLARPDVVINCIGIIKQVPGSRDYLQSLAINAELPHRLAKYCDVVGARLLHFSTDCVFSGKKGLYIEDDFPDAHDLYGRTKLLGEVDSGNSLTLRTSIIGHEIYGHNSLVDWFLGQTSAVKGYAKAIFSGLPTVEVARVLADYVIPTPELRGLYHLSVEPISKYDLLKLVAKRYGKDIDIIPDDELVIDRSLNSDRFREASGYAPPPWSKLIYDMHESLNENGGGDD